MVNRLRVLLYRCLHCAFVIDDRGTRLGRWCKTFTPAPDRRFSGSGSDFHVIHL